jgi:DNA invertase Pin-like site-specific DNA recombinase
MKRAFAYLRVSGRGQIEGDGFPRQRAAIKAYANAHDIRIVEWFEEPGVSGAKDLDDRPALQSLMLALHSDGVTLVLVERLDRLARDLMIQESILSDLRKHDFELISVAEPDLCSDDPSRTMMRQVLGAFAQYEKSMIVLKLRGARQRARQRDGVCEGRKPYGSLPGEQEIVQRMKELHWSGQNYSQIAASLNAADMLPRGTGKGDARKVGQWFPASVSRVLVRALA